MHIEDPSEPNDANDPMLPIEANEPMLAIDRTEPVDPMDSTESLDHSDHLELFPMSSIWRATAGRWSCGLRREPRPVTARHRRVEAKTRDEAMGQGYMRD